MNIAYTVVSIDYLAQAKTLADSLLNYNKGIKFFICLIGDKNQIADPRFCSTYNVIDTESNPRADFIDMRRRYSNLALSCALKPFFAEILINDFGADRILYFDSDILIFNSLNLVIEALEQSSIIITPHCLSPTQRHDKNRLDLLFHVYGIYNAGFFALRNTKSTGKFLEWWKDKMFYESKMDTKGRAYDQIWFNHVPIYFDEVYILKDVGYNMAVWNMSERKLSSTGGCFKVNEDTPLVFFHYSGYNIRFPQILSKSHPIYTFQTRQDVEPIFTLYHDLLQASKSELQLTPGTRNKNKLPGIRTTARFLKKYIAELKKQH